MCALHAEWNLNHVKRSDVNQVCPSFSTDSFCLFVLSVTGLAYLANLPSCVNFFFSSFLMIAWNPVISGSTGLIFTISSPNDRYLFVGDRSGHFFRFLKGRSMATNFGQNWQNDLYSTLGITNTFVASQGKSFTCIGSALLSFLPLIGGQIEYWPVTAGIRTRDAASVGWQVTRCDRV